jgi:hypothetical protein
MGITFYTKVIKQHSIRCDICEKTVYLWPEGWELTFEEIAIKVNFHNTTTHPDDKLPMSWHAARMAVDGKDE